MNDIVTVGDLDSQARGSGARKNLGKPQWWQLPVFALQEVQESYHFVYRYGNGCPNTIRDVIRNMGHWQQSGGDVSGGGRDELTRAMAILLYLLACEQGMSREPVPLRALASTVRVLEFGAVKYKAGNWAKGMPWSVCFSCTMSHLFAAAGGEVNDAESGISHLAHAMCNMLFLRAYEDLYPEGDDRLLEWSFATKPERTSESSCK
jgi:hypothetical protein